MFKLHMLHPCGFSAGTHRLTDNLPLSSNHAGFVTTSEKISSQPYAFRITSINTVFASERMISSAPADFARRIALIMSALCNNINIKKMKNMKDERRKERSQKKQSRWRSRQEAILLKLVCFFPFPSSSFLTFNKSITTIITSCPQGPWWVVWGDC